MAAAGPARGRVRYDGEGRQQERGRGGGGKGPGVGRNLPAAEGGPAGADERPTHFPPGARPAHLRCRGEPGSRGESAGGGGRAPARGRAADGAHAPGRRGGAPLRLWAGASCGRRGRRPGVRGFISAGRRGEVCGTHPAPAGIFDLMLLPPQGCDVTKSQHFSFPPAEEPHYEKEGFGLRRS